MTTIYGIAGRVNYLQSPVIIGPPFTVEECATGRVNLRTGAGWRAFFQTFFGPPPPPGPYDFP